MLPLHDPFSSAVISDGHLVIIKIDLDAGFISSKTAACDGNRAEEAPLDAVADNGRDSVKSGSSHGTGARR